MPNLRPMNKWIENYNYIDHRLHLLCQVIAKLNRTFVAPEEDDSHTNLAFNDAMSVISGRWIRTPQANMLMLFSIAKLEYWIYSDQHRILATIPATGLNLSEIEDHFELKLKDIGVDPKQFKEPLHFEINDYPFAEKRFEPFSEEQVASWQMYRMLANQACGVFLSKFKQEGEIRIWPHHFDTGVYFEYNSNLDFSFGWAMQDGLLGQPYYYFSPYAKNDYAINWENLPDLDYGHWHISEEWKGAVLPMLIFYGVPNNQLGPILESFINGSTAPFLTH